MCFARFRASSLRTIVAILCVQSLMKSTVLSILKSTTVAQDPRTTALRRTHLGSHAHDLSHIMIFSQPCPSSPVDWCPQSSTQIHTDEDSGTEIRP